VGNSIGGFFAASLAGEYPQLVTGCVLLNSAGRIVPDYIPDATAAQPGRSPVSGAFRRAAFFHHII
jgi:pimeloyl-ACP methyl ester carboxylesterase